MKGYIYIMSNESMTGTYKICSSLENPFKILDYLYIDNIKTPFIIEYCIYVENYIGIENLLRVKLTKYSDNRGFFRCELVKCIIELKHATTSQPLYKEKYRDKHLRSIIKEWEKYLKEQEEQKRREEIENIEREYIERVEEKRAYIEYLIQEKERQEKERRRRDNEKLGFFSVIICLIIGGFFSSAQNIWPLFIALSIGICIYLSCTKE